MKEISNAIPAHLMEGPSNEAKPKNIIGKDDFMKLLMAQMQNQDPLKPMDHHEMSAQLAQFSSLEQLTNIGKGIDNLHTGMGEESKLQALSMIGKKIQAAGNELSLQEGNSVTLHHALPKDYQPVKAVIFDSQGKIVREMELNSKTTNDIVWDGKSSEGGKLPSGTYTFRVAGVGPNGQTQEAGADLSGKVTGVEMDGKSAVLLVQTPSGATKVNLAKVRSVNMDEPSVPAVKNEMKLDAPPVAPPTSKVALNEVDEEAAEESGMPEESMPFREFSQIGGSFR